MKGTIIIFAVTIYIGTRILLSLAYERIISVFAVILLVGCSSFQGNIAAENAKHLKDLEPYGYTHRSTDSISDITATNTEQ
jgi:hypothetical protein